MPKHFKTFPPTFPPKYTNCTIFCVNIFKHSKHMTYGIHVPTLVSNTLFFLIFGEEKSYFLGILKIQDLFMNYMATTLKRLFQT